MIDQSLALHCRDVIATHSKSFALATRLLSERERDAAAAVYAFCRRADDAIDLSPVESRPAAIRRLFAELDDVYAGRVVSDPALVAFQRVVVEHAVPIDYPRELLLGMQMDVDGATYADLPALLAYCFRVAGTVGLMMCHVLGVREASALRHAAHLGMAMQLTNICRDVEEDWQNGRLYVPSSLLPRMSTTEPGLLSGEPPSSLRSFMAPAVRTLLAEAERLYRSGDRGLGALSFRSSLAVRAARLVYAAIGDEVAARGFDVFSGRVVVHGPKKIFLVLRAISLSLLDLPRRARLAFVPAKLTSALRFPHDVLPI